MAKSTFSGRFVSNNGFIQAGSNNIVDITAETTLTFSDHVGSYHPKSMDAGWCSNTTINKVWRVRC